MSSGGSGGNSRSSPVLPDAFNTKQDARDSRLKLRKNNEEVIRRHLQQDAKQKCAGEIKAFGQCAVDNGLLVVLNCRSKNRAMSECMDKYFNEDIVQKYLHDNGYEPFTVRKSFLDSVFTAVTGKK